MGSVVDISEGFSRIAGLRVICDLQSRRGSEQSPPSLQCSNGFHFLRPFAA